MKTKKIFYTEVAYLLGLFALALGAALMTQADFGLSMVVAPAYILHLKLSQFLPWYSFGVSEFVLQAVLLAALSIIMGRLKKGYLFSFVTALIYGVVLDLTLAVVSLIPVGGIPGRLIFFLLGMLACSTGVALFFHTYISPEAYELFVKEAAGKWNRDISKVKTAYDCCSCLAGIVLSFAFFGIGHFEGVKLGTIFCALVNGRNIGIISRWMENNFSFEDGLKLREFFEN